MKYLIASDLHGSAECIQRLLARFDAEKAGKLILLGDLYYHGPRNPLPDSYGPRDAAALLNARKDIIIAVRGNCDSEADEMVSDFTLLNSYLLKAGGKTVFFTHGHKHNMQNPPDTPFEALVYGHEHTGYIIKKGKQVFANPGSVSLPKNNTPQSYLVLNADEYAKLVTLELKNLNGMLIKSEEL